MAMEYQSLVAVGKIFGPRKTNPNNIDSLIQVLRENRSAVFSKDALAARKRRMSDNADEWLADDMKGVPTARDVNRLHELTKRHRSAADIAPDGVFRPSANVTALAGKLPPVGSDAHPNQFPFGVRREVGRRRRDRRRTNRADRQRHADDESPRHARRTTPPKHRRLVRDCGLCRTTHLSGGAFLTAAGHEMARAIAKAAAAAMLPTSAVCSAPRTGLAAVK